MYRIVMYRMSNLYFLRFCQSYLKLLSFVLMVVVDKLFLYGFSDGSGIMKASDGVQISFCKIRNLQFCFQNMQNEGVSKRTKVCQV